MKKVTTVSIVDDEADLREHIAGYLSAVGNLRCQSTYASAEEALEHLPREKPDVILMDINLGGMDGIECVRRLKALMPDAQVLMLTVFEDTEKIFRALSAGASGYLLKKTQPGQLIASVKEAAQGGAPMSPEVARRVIRLFREIRPPERADYNLSPHEIRILKLLVEGHNYETAATRLGVKPTTINFHLQNIYQKLQVHSKTEAVAKALRNRLI